MATITYVNFKKGLKHPKLSWMIATLDTYGIAHRVTMTVTGPMLQVQQGSVEIASEILNQELATFVAVDKNVSNSVPMGITVTIDDLPNDHEFFEAQLRGKSVEIPATPAQEVIVHEFPEVGDEDDPEDPEYIPDHIGQALSPALEVDEDEEDTSGLSWDFDDVDDEDDDEDDPVIDIEHTVVESDPPKPKERKKKKPGLPPVDPDFDDAQTEGDLSAPVDGDEFLKVDEVLAFEDITFPNVKDPIRMYDVDSSTISAMGAKTLTSDPLIVTVYHRFKSGAMVYRYNPVPRSDWNTELNLAIRRKNGIQEASVGSFFHHAIKVKAEEGTINCQRLTDNSDPKKAWAVVPPKAERTKQTKNRDS